MKKFVVAASLLALSFGAFAQEYKPVAGNVTAEIGLTGGIFNTATNLGTSGQTLNGVGVPQLKFRYFLADQLALRVGLNISQNKTTNNFYEATPGSGTGTQKIRTSTTMLNLGIEKHFSGTDRLSTYAGADLTLLFGGAHEKWDNYDGTGFADGFKADFKNTTFAGNNASRGLGLRAVVGANYYFVEKVYLGAEFGWGFLASKDKDVEAEVTPGAGAPTTTTKVKSPGKNFNLAPSTTASVVIGFRF